MESSIPNSSSPILQHREEESMSSISRGIPEDVYHEPVKSIKNCKYVGKSWFSIISNPSFVKLHLQRNKDNPSSNSLLLANHYAMNSISYDLLESSLSIEEIEDRAVSLLKWYPPLDSIGAYSIRLFGSCNGLLFVCMYENNSESVGGKDFLYLLNPATDEYKEIIPHSPDIKFHDEVCISGLEYDGKNEDYKFVIGVCSGNVRGLATLVEIYSLRSNSWKTIETHYIFIDDEFWYWKTGVLVNGDIHWLAKGECGVCIVYLDFSNDTPCFKEIQLPTVPNLEFMDVNVLEEGSLCVVSDNGDSVGLGRVHVWEMKVYRVPESWTKRYVIANETISTSIMLKDSVSQIWSSKNGKIVFVDSRQVVLYDPMYRTAVQRNLDTLGYSTSGANYVESLVSLSTSA